MADQDYKPEVDSSQTTSAPATRRTHEVDQTRLSSGTRLLGATYTKDKGMPTFFFV